MLGRIPRDFIDELLTRVDIIDVIDSYVPLRKAGKNHQGLCPFHEEKTPSFSVSQEKQFYHCFGCGANGTAITFLMEHGGMDFVDAIEQLASLAGVEVPREGGNRPHRDSGHSELYELMEMVVSFYCTQLREHPQAGRAVDYLKQRGISGKLAAVFELGFAPPGWDNLLSKLGGSEAAQQRLAKAGMTLERGSGGYYDRFRDRIIYPIRDQRGRAIGFGGRVLDDSSPKYLNSPETAIFHKGRELYGLYQARNQSKDLKQLYIVEGYMDVLALAQFEIHNAVATLGTAITKEHLERLFRVSPQLIFCFDGDQAGKKAAWRALEIALSFLRDGRQCHFIFFPEGDDPDSFIRAHGREIFEDPETHIPLSTFLLDSLKQDIDLSTSEGRALLAEKSLPHLNKLPANALRELLLNDIAIQSNLSVDYLKQQLQGKQPARLPAKKHTLSRVSPKRNSSNLVTRTISLLLQQPKLAKICHLSNQLSNIDMDGIDFLKELVELIEQKPDISCGTILEHWRDSKYEQRLSELAAMENLLSTSEQLEAELNDLITKIKQSNYKKQRLAQVENISNRDQLRGLFPDSTPTKEK